mgnify:CR=1 FL=1|tara:strand:- start:3044 stop:3412 length:369 start_codon:yes stop_codon:yes gene_type:complete
MNDLTSKKFKDSFNEAIDLFNNQKWYEAHDAFEDIWNDLVGDERQVVQGILQVSVSQFHLNKGNVNGAMILIGEGLGRIRYRISDNLGIDLLTLCGNLESLLNKLHTNMPLNDSDVPFLKRL